MTDQIQYLKKIFRQHHLRPSKLRGQNFLINPDVVNELVKLAEIKSGDSVLEIGPGLGILTKEISQKAKSVWAVEVDKGLASVLPKIMSDYPNVKIIPGDAMKLQGSLAKTLPASYKVVANLPFSITSHFLRQYLETDKRPTDMTLIVQKELGDRICAPPGQMSLISVAVQFYGRPTICELVSHQNFWPQPKVDTAIMRIDQIGQGYSAKIYQSEIQRFWQIVRIGFSARRKQLKNNLKAGLKIDSAQIVKIMHKIGLNEQIRAQDLTIDQWLKLAKGF
ncbi:MAG: 16S rRNA (adenine(1518)-N(6)/adenine(1519)-N(6))-dimethyltransferase RsmA [Patescibacteria group bacterium]